MDRSIWDNALKLLNYDSNIDKFTYDSILCKMSVAHCDNDVLVLAARDEFSLNLVKGQKLGKIIEEAIKTANGGKPCAVKFILEGDENALNSSVNSEKKAARQAKSEVPTSTGLNGEFTFANFIVGDCNRFAHASAVSVASKPGQKQRNPFFLWGNSGLGKTHLMKAIGNAIIEQHPEKKVIYTTCEAFTNAFITCTLNKNYTEFRKKYRTVDVLLIDDIQFLIGKEGVQTEFFNTFEALIEAGKQIVITCDKAPSNLTELNSRLTSRFQDGIMFDVQPPDFETRKAIFLSKLKNENFNLSDEIIDYVCENVTTNIRQLNGAFNTISSYVTLANGELSLEDIQKIIMPIVSPNKKKYLTPEIVINAVANYYDLTPDKLTSKLRSAEISTARNVAMFICRDYLELKYEKIGQIFGGRKHTTVMHGCDNVDADETLKAQAEEIVKLIS
ncbi:chromosomal replication initiator protein DnaA [Butyrivibrio sp. AE2032]|uniref:chromosomal replication initiator protein DnaA n=1 Tax=Butyrivibrio sp. AE2032 TaxID=1458463 RepID=UPI00068F1037|nr:chromosomal replication initiator protein DnaA [Butyrivibrio sp. AE2032]